MKTKTETELVADFHGGREVNLVKAIRFYSMFGCVESFLGLEQWHKMVSYISVEEFPGLLQTMQKYIGRWREQTEVKTILKQSEAYQRPLAIRHVVGSYVTPLCKGRYPENFVSVERKARGL